MSYLYDEPGIYAIHVAGRVDRGWSERLGGLSIAYRESESDSPTTVTALIGPLPDQAALRGVLETLYNSRYPLLLVTYLRPSLQDLRDSGRESFDCTGA